MTNPVVWAVCEAEWESSGPVVVFTTEALANEHCAALNAEHRGNYDVQARPLLDAAPRKVTWHWRQISIRERDGAISRGAREPYQGWDYDHADPEVEVAHPRNAAVINATATSDEAASAACEAELARRTVAS